jgi:hypothetical protein
MRQAPVEGAPMKKLLWVALAAAAAPVSAGAQAPAMERPAPPAYQEAPWWMREPILASLGEVRAELPANRARLSAGFESVAATAAEATRQSAEKVRVLNQALAAYGAERVRVETSFSTRPLYAQYKDKTGTVQDNERADKIDRYAVTARVSVGVRDIKVVERVYATLIAARPTSTQPAYFTLVPDNATNAALAKAAVADAAMRARAAAADAGVKLGAVKLIDPTGRACSTDVLITGAERGYGAPLSPTPLPLPSLPPLPVMAPASVGALESEAANLQINLQPPLETLTAQACVIYALGPQS